MSDEKREQETEEQPLEEVETESTGEGGEVEEEEGDETVAEVVAEKSVDDDLDRRNPQYIPKGGSFYEHDNRTLDDEPVEETPEADKKKKMWKEPKSGERWLHDQYVEIDQGPKSARELVDIYGYDIRNEENAPRARRRRKYGRGPEKYDRKWDDEGAYVPKPTRKPNMRRRPDDFPPLPNQVENEEKPAPTSGAWRGPNRERQNHRNAPPGSKPMSPPHHQESPKPNKTRSDDHIKPFRTEANRVHESPRSRAEAKAVAKDIQDLTHSIAATSIQSNPRRGEQRGKDSAPEQVRNQPVDAPINRQNPKRYSNIRKNHSFQPEDIPELDPVMDMPQSRVVPPHIAQQQRQQDILVPNVSVLPRYPDQFNGNPAFLPGRTILQPIPQPGLSPQAAMPPNLSPQMAGIEMQPPPNYVQPPVFMAPPEVINFQSYPSFPQTQNREVYQATSGITYYSPEVQTGSVQNRALPQRRKAAIPIVPPPENQ